MHNGVNWHSIVEKAISTIIAAIIISAFALVWKAAMSVDSRVAEAQTITRALVDNLATALAQQQITLNNLSNELYSIIWQPEILTNNAAEFVKQQEIFRNALAK